MSLTIRAKCRWRFGREIYPVLALNKTLSCFCSECIIWASVSSYHTWHFCVPHSICFDTHSLSVPRCLNSFPLLYCVFVIHILDHNPPLSIVFIWISKIIDIWALFLFYLHFTTSMEASVMVLHQVSLAADFFPRKAKKLEGFWIGLLCTGKKTLRISNVTNR